MGIIKDFMDDTDGYYFSYRARCFLSPKVWFRLAKYRKQRANRGWSDRDAWSGGDHIAEVCVGILNHLQSDNGHVDWAGHFSNNYINNYGFKSLNEVADCLQLYLEWYGHMRHNDEFIGIGMDTRIAMDAQIYEQAKEAMHFVADNIGGLWD